MNEPFKSIEIPVGRQGQLVLPVVLQQALGFEEGDVLVARQEGGRLILEKPDIVKQRLKARFAQVPKDRHLVDELIAERRAAAQREMDE